MTNPLYFAEKSAEAYDRWTLRVGNVECSVSIESWGRCVAFRGTEADFGDILRDVRAVPWYDRDLGWCHAGFLKGARAIWPILAPFTKNHDPTWFTGHSLGGALATLCAAMMVREGRAPAGLVTFGCPRVGFSLEGRLAGLPVRRYVHGADCVPSHPWPIWGYRHAGAVTRLNGGRGIAEPDRFLDHKMAGYVAAVRMLGGRSYQARSLS